MSFKDNFSHIVCSLLLALLRCSLQDNTNVVNRTHSTGGLTFDPHELNLELKSCGSFNMSLSLPLNESIVFILVEDFGGVVLLPVQNVTLQQADNVTLTAIGVGRAVISANTPFEPHDYIKVSDAYVGVNVFYSQEITVISDVVGWIYFVCWTLSFYPQIIENYQRKSVVGLDFNYLALNVMGHNCYNIFNIGLFWIPTVKAEYKALYPRGVIPVRINDVGYSIQAVLATGFTVLQCFYYERGTQRISYTCIAILAGIIVFLLITLVLAIVSIITWLDYLYYFSYIKLVVTVLKSCPQMYYNYKRKSTSGFSIWSVLVDLAGGFLSMVQMFLLAYNFNDWISLFGDLSKFALGFMSVVVCIIYTIQHYVLYRKPYSKKAASLILPHANTDEKTETNCSNSSPVRY